MNEARQPFEKAAAELAKMQSLEQILETATAFEASARDFYTELAPRVSKRIRWLVEELAAEEQEHHRLFSSLAEKTRNSDSLKIKVETPQSDGRFTDCLHLPDLGEHPDDQDVLQYALGREQAAMEQYRALADSTAPGDIHDLFAFLANEETKHKAELEKLYYEMIHT